MIINCFLLSYGLDVPAVECVVLARPTRSVVLYLQMAGRGMRPAPGKAAFTLIDHGRVVENLGLPTDDFGWSLDDERNVNRSAADKHRAASIEQPRVCPECAYTWLVSEGGAVCELRLAADAEAETGRRRRRGSPRARRHRGARYRTGGPPAVLPRGPHLVRTALAAALAEKPKSGAGGPS